MIKLEIDKNKVNVDFGNGDEQELKGYFHGVGESIVLLVETNESEDKQSDCEQLLAMIKYSMYNKLRNNGHIDGNTISLSELL